MEYRYLGGSGLQVSAVGLGTNNFGRRMNAEETATVVDQALDLGVNFLDTSNSYGGGLSEEFIGRALKGKRQEAIIATKFASKMGDGPNNRGASRHHIMDQIGESLRRLDTDYIDVYLVHFPDPHTPIEETLGAMDDLVHQGKVRYIGCSNFSAWQMCEALWTSKSLNLTSFVTVQNNYSMVRREIERELVPLCEAYNIGIVPYYPLAAGFLTGKYRPGEPPPEGTRLVDTKLESRTWAMTDRTSSLLPHLENFAAERDHTVGELAIAWLTANPLVSSVIAGATKTWQVEANVKGSEWPLTADDVEEIDRILTENGF